MAYLALNNVEKTYPNGFQAVKGISLAIGKGEFVVFLGPSGCGKTTTLRMIAGLEQITGGQIVLDGTELNNLEPKDRDVSMIFQSYAVWPHMTVEGNIAYPLKLKKVPKAEIAKTIEKVAEICDIKDYLKRYPTQLSGGQRQRIAVARAIAMKSKLFLMDEPLSNLDAKLRVSVRTFLKQIHNEYNATTIFVTHDQSEAMALADRIVVINKGLIEQVGTSEEIYFDCETLFVANFMGMPPANIEKVTIEQNEGGIFAVSGQIRLKVEDAVATRLQADYVGKEVYMAIRPESMVLHGQSPFTQSQVEVMEPQGSHTIIVVKVNEKLWKMTDFSNHKFTVGEQIAVSVDPSKVMFFDLDTEKRIR